MAIESTQTKRTIHLHGLYENDDGEEQFFAVSMDVDNSSPISAAVSNCLTMRGIPPWKVTEFQTSYIERKNQLVIDSKEFSTPDPKQ